MTLTLLLPWFPIILATAVGGRLVGHPRGLGLGILCALFWTVLVQASMGTELWDSGWTVATMVAGSVAIATMGLWTSCTASPDDSKKTAPPAQSPRDATEIGAKDHDVSTLLGATIDRFDDWLAEHVDDVDPWPAFDGFIRSVLFKSCGATHVKSFRLLGDGQQLEPLHTGDSLAGKECIPARLGIKGHVLTSGRPYLFCGVPYDDPTVSEFAANGREPIAWSFPIRIGEKRCGIVSAGHVDMSMHNTRSRLSGAEQLVNLFWRTLHYGVHSKTATEIDAVTGLRTRSAFLTASERALRQSYKDGEPVAVAVLDLEGLRAINDSGRWESADELMRSVGDAVLAKLRADDVVGRFDGSRLLLMLRRVDPELATLIINQLAVRIRAQCSVDRERGTVRVRCGLAGSGSDMPELRALITRAVHQCRRARRDDVVLASDWNTPESVGVACS